LPVAESTEKNAEKKGPKGEKGFLKKQQNLQGKEVVDKNSGTAPLAPYSYCLQHTLLRPAFAGSFFHPLKGMPLFSDGDRLWLALICQGLRILEFRTKAP
jgi:hypothetical protein